MCLVLFALDAHPAYRLVLAANRDELYARPTAPAAPWPEAPEVIAGRDLSRGGTWMGVTRGGRWAAVTNFRDPFVQLADAPSRGHLVSDYLRGDLSPEAYVQELSPRAGSYNGFNLLVADPGCVVWYSNRQEPAGRGEPQGQARALGPGVYGLSNHLLNTPWPKVTRGRRELASLLAERGDALEPDRLLDLLLDRTLAADAELPDTGVDPQLERALSASFIATAEYGTRSSTALLIDRSGQALLVERTFECGTSRWSEARHAFPIEQ